MFLTNFPKANSKCSLFDLELTWGFSRGVLEYLKRFVLSPHKKGDVKRRLICYVKIMGKYCQIRSTTNLSLCCVSVSRMPWYNVTTCCMLQEWPNFLVNSIRINFLQIFNNGHFKIFCHLQLLVYSDVFIPKCSCKVLYVQEDSRRGLLTRADSWWLLRSWSRAGWVFPELIFLKSWTRKEQERVIRGWMNLGGWL